MRGGERVGTGALEHRGDDGGLAADIGVRAIILRAELDAGDVRYLDLAAVLVGADHHIGELLGIGQAALRFDVELEGVTGRVRRLAERTGGDLDVLRAQGRDDFACGQIERGGAAGIDPDPHRIIARAEQLHVADAVDPAQAIAHLRQRVIGDIAAIERAVGRDQVHHHQEVRAGLARDDAQALHVLGQTRHRNRDAVLHQHLCRIEVGADLEGDGDRQLAVAGRLRRLVQHIVDTVDFLLDRRGDGFRDRLG